ncbi:MAG: hypothetical protein F6K42_00480 [Leptolyngbya sp. SIO1D8]|nr:hypothetical protein [Leptolyngbya sp. SIO1D8]
MADKNLYHPTIEQFWDFARKSLADCPLCVTIINRGWRVDARVVNGGGL